MAIKVILKEVIRSEITSEEIRVGTVFKGTIGVVYGLFRKYNLIIDNLGNRKNYIISLDEDCGEYWDYNVNVKNYQFVNIEIKEV